MDNIGLKAALGIALDLLQNEQDIDKAKSIRILVEFLMQRWHGLLVQREDTCFARRKSGFDSPAVHLMIMRYIVEYKDFEGQWKLRGEYSTYSAALARWQNHYRHCSYLACRIRKYSRLIPLMKKLLETCIDLIVLAALTVISPLVWIYWFLQGLYEKFTDTEE